MKTKTAVVIAVIVIIGILVLSSGLEITRLERSYYCDDYRVSVDAPISDDCIKKKGEDTMDKNGVGS